MYDRTAFGFGTRVHGDFATVPLLSGELPALVPRPPQWVDLLLGDVDQSRVSGKVRVVDAGACALFSTTIPDAVSLPPATLRASVSEAYIALGDAMDARGLHSVRLWNFVPSPGEVLGAGLDRYMVFNAGRFDAYSRWYAVDATCGPQLATASAVGVTGHDLTIFSLALERAGTPIENPRQTSSWRYSRRYGPKPPCFARATSITLNGERRLLIGGTASIVGEDSRHIGDVAAQVDETFVNIRALIAAARGTRDPRADELTRLFDLRVYVRHPADTPLIRTMIDACCPALERREMCRSQICRPELLVEIEGVARI